MANNINSIGASSIHLDELLRKMNSPEASPTLAKLSKSLPLRGPLPLKPATPHGLVDFRKDKLLDFITRDYVSNSINSSTPRLELKSKLVELFADVADQNGVISGDEISRRFGPAGTRLFLDLVAAKSPKYASPLSDRYLLESASDITRDALLAKTEGGTPRLPVLDALKDSVAPGKPFEGFHFMGVQHLFASSGSLFEVLHEKGIPYDQMHLVGKNYSTNYRTAASLSAKGVHVAKESIDIRGGFFEKVMGKAIERELDQIIQTLPQQPEKNPKPCVLLIDDGAEAIKILHEKYPDYAPYFVAVEQTRRGARILHELDLKCPVANVAESDAKLQWESPMIGHSVVLEINRKLDELESYGIKDHNEATVIGYGAVGQGVARALKKRGMEVHIFDPDPSRQALALQEGMVAHADKNEALHHAHVLVSCVGKETMDIKDFEVVPEGAILVNAASADDELNPEYLRKLQDHAEVRDDEGRIWGRFQGKTINLGYGPAEAHSDRIIKLESGKEMLLAHNGFVINMTGERDPIPPRYIQLTRTLLFMGASAAQKASEPGIVDIPKDWQQALVGMVQRQLKKTSEDLKNPRWEKVDGYPEAVHYDPPEHLFNREKLTSKIVSDLGPPANPGSHPYTASKDTPDRIYGYHFGKVGEGSREAMIDKLVGQNQGTLKPEAAAIYEAVTSINKALGARLATSTTQQSDALSERGKKSQLMGQTSAELPDSTAEFEFLYAHYALVFTTYHLQNKLGRAPENNELKAALKTVLKVGKVPTEAALEALRTYGDEGEKTIAS